MNNDDPIIDDGELDRLLEEFTSSGWEAEHRQLVEPVVSGVTNLEREAGHRSAPRTWTTGAEDTWVDSNDAPFSPIPRPGRPWASLLLSMVMAAVGLAGLAWLIVPELKDRVSAIGDIHLTDSILTAHAVPMSTNSAATVEEILIDVRTLRDEVIPKGTKIARVSQRTLNGLAFESAYIVAPFDARFASIDAPAGSVTQPGTPVVTLYDPAEMTVLTTVKAETLDLFRRGMTVELRNHNVGVTLTGVVDSAVPLLGTDHDPTSSRYINVRIIPDLQAVRNLVPGIRFDVTVKADSVSEDAPKLLFTGDVGN